MAKPKNPPLFWQIETSEPGLSGPVVTEITLRDLFAAAALAGELASQGNPDTGVFNSASAPAENAYMLADAMLTARDQEPPE